VTGRRQVDWEQHVLKSPTSPVLTLQQQLRVLTCPTRLTHTHTHTHTNIIARLTGKNFSKVSSLLNFQYKITTQLTFENFYQRKVRL